MRRALNAITNILRRAMQRKILPQRREGNGTTKAEVEIMWPQANQQLPEAKQTNHHHQKLEETRHELLPEVSVRNQPW